MKNPRRPAAITNDRTRSVAWPSPFPPLYWPGEPITTTSNGNNANNNNKKRQTLLRVALFHLIKCWTTGSTCANVGRNVNFILIFSEFGNSHKTNKLSSFDQIRSNSSQLFASRLSPSREQVTDNPFHNSTTRTRFPSRGTPARGVTFVAREYRCNIWSI